ncbi:MAG TPA: hypothetical protein VLM89_06585 [Phycisphaerae bacterium]|nr:hypothetical protein [Phycisphaerae bacterium]
MSAAVTAEVDGAGFIRLRLNVQNNTTLAIRRVLFPHIPWMPTLGDSDDDRLLIPWNNGQLIKAPGKADGYWEAD